MAGQELREKAQALKEEAWQLARQSLEQGDKQLYKEMIEITERLTELTNRQEHMTGANNVHADKQGLLPIFKRYKGVRYDAQLDRSKINGGRGECVLFRGRWQTVSGAATAITNNQVNGWRNFWKYQRADGTIASIEELR